MQVFNYFKIKVKFIYFSYESVPSSENSYNEIFFTKKKRYADQISPTVRVLLLFKQAVFERCRHYRRKIAPLLWTTTFHIIYYWLFRLTCSCFQSLFQSCVTSCSPHNILWDLVQHNVTSSLLSYVYQISTVPFKTSLMYFTYENM